MQDTEVYGQCMLLLCSGITRCLAVLEDGSYRVDWGGGGKHLLKLCTYTNLVFLRVAELKLARHLTGRYRAVQSYNS